MGFSQLVLVDSNIFIFSINKLHPNYKEAVDLLEKCSKLNLKPAVSDLILSEVVTFLAHNGAFEEANSILEYTKSNRIELIPFEPKVFLAVSKLIKEKCDKHISFCDYYSICLVKSSKRFYGNGILSLDEHFKGMRLFIDIN